MSFICKERCKAECCGMMSFTKAEFKRFKKKAQRKYRLNELDSVHVQVITKDRRCVFLNENDKCEIYIARPYVCKVYGTIKELQCPYVDMQGNKRSEEEVDRTKDEIHRQIKENMNAFHEKYTSSKIYLKM